MTKAVNEKMAVYTIITEDYGYTGTYEEVLSELESMEVGGVLDLVKREMTPEEFESLPEANI